MTIKQIKNGVYWNCMSLVRHTHATVYRNLLLEPNRFLYYSPGCIPHHRTCTVQNFDAAFGANYNTISMEEKSIFEVLSFPEKLVLKLKTLQEMDYALLNQHCGFGNQKQAYEQHLKWSNYYLQRAVPQQAKAKNKEFGNGY